MSQKEPALSGKAEGDQLDRGLEPGESKNSKPDKDSPKDKDFGAEDTPQQGGL